MPVLVTLRRNGAVSPGAIELSGLFSTPSWGEPPTKPRVAWTGSTGWRVPGVWSRVSKPPLAVSVRVTRPTGSPSERRVWRGCTSKVTAPVHDDGVGVPSHGRSA